MASAFPDSPPFSPLLLAGIATRPLPLGPLNIILARIFSHMHKRHKAVFTRLASLENPHYLIVPTDLPISFSFNAHRETPGLRAERRQALENEAAIIRGPLASLLALLQGSVDGDALFFSRQLSIEGDTEAVLALRNAVDGNEIDLVKETQNFTGPLKHLMPVLNQIAAKAWCQCSSDFDLVAHSVTGVQERQISQNRKAIRSLQEQVKLLSKSTARRNR